MKIKLIPITTKIPNITSYLIIFLLYNNGSKKDVKKAPKESTERVTETLDSLIALKNVIQCKAIKTPAKIIFKTRNLLIIIFFFKRIEKKSKIKKAIAILYHTRDIESIEIKEPKIAVNPKINTIK